MRTLLYCTCYDPPGKNIALEGRNLVLTLLASRKLIWESLQIEIHPWTN